MVFQDYHGDAPECTLKSGVDSPLTGNSPTFSTETVREYGSNLMFEPVPLSMLYTDAQKPQVLIKVNGIEGVCPELNCDYVYVETSALITSQALSANDLTIVGTGLPTDVASVSLASSKCDSTTIVASDTQITCTLSTSPAAGSWDVQLKDASGLIPIDSTAGAIDVALSVTSVTPGSGLNQVGGDILTLVGSGFDTRKESMSV